MMHIIQLNFESVPNLIVTFYLIFGSYVNQRMPMGIHAITTIWQSYINAIHSSIHDRSKYLAIIVVI